MIAGLSLVKEAPEMLFVGVTTWLAGWAALIWGCVNFARGKVQSGWFGLLGYLMLPGLVILACMPNHRRRRTPEWTNELKDLTTEDQRSGYRYLLSIAPIGLIGLLCLGFWAQVARRIDAAQWQTVSPPDAGF